MTEWTLDRILAGRRLRTRSSYAAVQAARVIEAGFSLLATFDAPHYSVLWQSYTDEQATLLSSVFGSAIDNPHHLRRQP